MINGRALSIGLFALSIWCAASVGEAASPPNIILFIADDMAWDDSTPYGRSRIQTPNLTRLAAEGMRFDAAFLTCSSCSPSRSSIITGRYPHSTGAMRLHEPLPGEQVTFVELLRKAGYYTAASGKWHLGPATKPKFDRVVEKQHQWPAVLAERPKDKPFFFWFASTDPHRDYQLGAIPKPHTPEDVVVPPYLPDTPKVRADLALYYDEIGRLDTHVGEVLDALAEEKIEENTLVLFISDNGRPFPRDKTTIYDSGIRTPWIVRWPAGVKPGTTCDRLVSSVDIAPTFLELAGAAKAESFQGVSFLPLLKDPQQSIRPFVFAEHNWHDFDDHARAVRNDRFKYIETAYTDVPNTPPADAVRSPSFQEMRRLRDAGQLTPAQMRCFELPRPPAELYDLTADPYELKNLAGDPNYADQQAELRSALAKWREETQDRVPDARTPDGFDRETGVSTKKAK